MSVQKCPDCGANMILVNYRDGSQGYQCNYCGKNIHIQPQEPQGAVGQILSFATKALNSYNERKNPANDPYIEELRRQVELASGKQKEKLQKKLNRELQYRSNLMH